MLDLKTSGGIVGGGGGGIRGGGGIGRAVVLEGQQY